MPRHRRWRRDAVEHRRREHRRGQHGGRGGLNGPAAVGVLPAGHRCARGGADLHVRGAAGGAAGQGTGAARRGPGGVPGALARRRPAHSCSYAARGIGGIAGVGGLLRRRSRRTGRAHELGRAVGVSRTAARTPRLPRSTASGYRRRVRLRRSPPTPWPPFAGRRAGSALARVQRSRRRSRVAHREDRAALQVRSDRARRGCARRQRTVAAAGGGDRI